MQTPETPPPEEPVTPATVSAVRRKQRRATRMRMLCRFLLFCLNHGHSIFVGLHTVAIWVKRAAPFIAKVLVQVS